MPGPGAVDTARPKIPGGSLGRAAGRWGRAGGALRSSVLPRLGSIRVGSRAAPTGPRIPLSRFLNGEVRDADRVVGWRGERGEDEGRREEEGEIRRAGTMDASDVKTATDL